MSDEKPDHSASGQELEYRPTNYQWCCSWCPARGVTVMQDEAHHLLRLHYYQSHSGEPLAECSTGSRVGMVDPIEGLWPYAALEKQIPDPRQ